MSEETTISSSIVSTDITVYDSLKGDITATVTIKGAEQIQRIWENPSCLKSLLDALFYDISKKLKPDATEDDWFDFVSRYYQA